MKLIQNDNYGLVQFEDSELELFDVTTSFTELNRLHCNLILDFGNMPVDLSRTESYLIAMELQEHKHLRSHKIGLISNGNGHGIAKIAEFARRRGLDVQTFPTLDSATTWLRAQTESTTD